MSWLKQELRKMSNALRLRRERIGIRRSWFEVDLLHADSLELAEHLAIKNTLDTRAKYLAAHLFSRHTLDAQLDWRLFNNGAYAVDDMFTPLAYWVKPVAMSVEEGAGGPGEACNRIHERDIMGGVDQNIAYFRTIFAANQANYGANGIDKINIMSGDKLRCEYIDDIGADPPPNITLSEDYAEIECVLWLNGGAGTDRWMFLERVEDYDVYTDDPSDHTRLDLPNGNGNIIANDSLMAIYWCMPTGVSASSLIASVSLTDKIMKTADYKLATSWYIEFDP